MEFFLANSKLILLILLITAFVAVLIYTFGNRQRGKRLESYRDIPFLDEDKHEASKGKDDE